MQRYEALWESHNEYNMTTPTKTTAPQTTAPNMTMLLNVPQQLRTKGERAEFLYGYHPDITTYDCALPLMWVQQAQQRIPSHISDNISAHLVTCYYKDKSMRIMPITDTGMLILATLATYIN